METKLNSDILQWISQCPFQTINTPKLRPNWNEYFLLLAFLASRRSSCFRSQCGAVIVKDNNVISTGYNGSPTYQKNCQEIGFCYRNDHHIKSGTQLELCRACGSHSETNAIALASKNGHSTNNTTIYIYGNSAICTQCKAMIANAGIKYVIYCTNQGKIYEINVEKDWTVHPIDTD
ncbi:MAG: dCMP deaminase family protein [Acidithiobacillus sp.]|jgi:dCMP deaminase|uniref:deoxycytidylate deaminase n=1 Tax=Acidithiobacillus sp. TaxID=1872118 RepID=UPI00355E23A0